MDRYALVIGISQYEGMDALTKPAGDAIALAQVLTQAGWRVTCLSDRVTYEVLENALKTFLERQAARQDALIYFTGHGFTVEESEDDRRGYLAMSDCTIDFEKGAIVSQRRGLSFTRLNGLIGRAQLSSLVVLLDCCHGGLFVEDGLVKRSFQASPDQNFCWIAACRSFQQAYARGSESHSLFTGALLAGLRAGGEVTVLSVLRSVNAAFKQLALQEPIYIGVGKDIPLISPVSQNVTPIVNSVNPYQGLRAFTAETRQFFFGRDREIQTLVQKVQDCKFVAVIGASGSGKSSVVRAGLIPRLEELGWRVLPVMMPGTDPIAALQSSIDSLEDSTENTLLVVDQFEEVFTLCRDRSEQSKFIQALMNLKLRVVVTMRADFVEACLADGALTRSIQADAVYLGPMMGEALEAAIEQPAIVQGATLQPKLLAQILQDVAEEENCLPLLEFALFELWERRAGAELTFDSYRKLEGLAGALNAHADEIYKQLAIQKREHWVKRVMLRLVRTGEGTKDTRQRQYKAELLEMAKDDIERESIEAVINALVNGRLLVSDRVDHQDVIDLSHEALMRSWKRLVTWREGDRELRRIVDAIVDAKRKWIEQGKKRRDLLEGRLLKDAGRLLKDAPAEVFGAKGFIRKSLWVRRSEFASWMTIPLLLLGIPTEYFWREEVVRQDYDRIEKLDNGDPRERLAVLNLAGGCWNNQRFARRKKRNLHDFLNYFQERALGNCRALYVANLSGVRLNSENLSGTSFAGANLSNAILQSTNLSGAILDATNLSGGELQGANLGSATLKVANLSGADLGDVNLSDANLEGANLSGASLERADLSSAKLHGTNLSGAKLVNANLENVQFKCFEYGGNGEEKKRKCPNLKDTKWDENTNWQNIKGWEIVENIPPTLKQQLGLK